MLSLLSTTTLNNGVEMPWFGLGVFQVPEGSEVIQSVKWAMEAGYRSVDTASLYANERGVGTAIRESGVPREEVFVTTKLWNSDQGYNSTLKALSGSLVRLGMDYVDLYLVHWHVNGKSLDTWRAMEELNESGLARAVGVSNYTVQQLEELVEHGKIAPAVNQVEFHPRLLQPELLKFCGDHGIRVEAWCPIMRGAVKDIPEISEIATAHGKTEVQVVLRWDLQHGVVTIPKSVHRDRIFSNAEIFDFELSEAEVAAIDALDRNERIGGDPNNVTW